MSDNTHATLTRLRAWFDAALALPAAEREPWLAAHIASEADREAVRALLAEDATAGFVDVPAEDHIARLAAPELEAESLIGRQVGAFRIVRALGQGGMGAVFLGERVGTDFTQRVAIKLLRRGLYSPLEQRLFQRERRVLARLDHPNVARLIDGGVTDAGIPYLVMEFVDGVPITQYTRAHALSLHQRLDLFTHVCLAVEAAHRSLVVHRDIKPSNIFVSSTGEVKLLDFGIAKLLDETDSGTTSTAAVFTPDYAAPEQVHGGAITTATDVYALGVLLHELLVGTRPEPSPSGLGARRPSSLVARNSAMVSESGANSTRVSGEYTGRQLRGDLDNIILKALDPEPERRYASAGTFVDDIDRHLSGKLVLAHPPTRWYRTRKFVLRHRGGVMVTAILVVAVLAALGVALWQAQIARQQAERASGMRDFMVSAFEEAEPSLPREGPPRITEVVKQAIAKARTDKNMPVAVRTELLTPLGAVLRVQGRVADAVEVLRWNYDQALPVLGKSASLLGEAGQELARTLVIDGAYGEASALIDTLRAQTPEATAARIKIELDAAFLASKQNELESARADADRGLQLARARGEPKLLLYALSTLGNVQLAAHDDAGAVATFEELVRSHEREHGPQHLSVATSRAALARAYRHVGRLDDAEREARAALAIDKAVLPRDDWRHANHLNALLVILRDKRDFAAALDAAKEGLRIDSLAFPPGHPEISNDLYNVGELQFRLEDYAAATISLREALKLIETKFGVDHFQTATARASYGEALARSDDRAGGEAQLRRAITSLANAQKPDMSTLATSYEKLARLQLDGNDPSGALTSIEQIDLLVTKFTQPEAYWQGRPETLRAAALLAQGHAAEAQQTLTAAAAALAGTKNPDAVLQAEVPLLRARAAMLLDDTTAAQNFAAEGAARLSTLRNPPSRLRREAATR